MIIEESSRLAREYGFVHSEYLSREWSSEDFVKEIMADVQESIDRTMEKSGIDSDMTDYEKWLKTSVDRFKEIN